MHYNDDAAGRISNLDGISKADLNNQLLKPLSDSVLKKTSKADLLAMVEAECAKKEKKPRKERVLEDRVLVPATTAPDAVKAVIEGSKRAILLQTLAQEGGCTLPDLEAALGWNRSTVTSSFAVDCKQVGFGVERRNGRYFLLYPAGFGGIPVAPKGTPRAAAVAACR